MDNKTDFINVMQQYLQILRKINGWTAEDVAQKLGVTKQTISNLENKKVCMTKVQYIALRTIFEYEIRIENRNDVLKKVMYILFYSPINCCEECAKPIYEVLKNLAAAAAGGISGSQLSILLMTLLSPIQIMNGINVDLAMNISAYSWLDDIS